MCPDTYVKYIRFNVFIFGFQRRVSERERESDGEMRKNFVAKIAQHKYTLNGVTAAV